MPETVAAAEPSFFNRALHVSGLAVAWAWAVVAGGGGFGLILTEGPLPLTHGWYAMFSGIALCPLTAWLVKRCAAVELSYPVRLATAFAIILAGRLALILHVWPLG
ncbi:MAG TPA: hypothetical protein VMU08_12380 [Rhizomicrobium sp.]|nr:hypothetical protein [Rhizomicrobium sp.]